MNVRTSVVLLFLMIGSACIWLLEQQVVRAEITPRPILYLMADVQRQLERITYVATRVSAEEENRLGRDMAGYLQERIPKPSARSIWREQYIARVGMRLAARAERAGIDYTFHYIPDPDFVNAFALPGGQIFFGEGLYDLFETEDELAAILGHEISHVDRRHCIELFQYELAAQKLGLDPIYAIASIPLRIYKQSYTKEQELEADRAGIRLAVEEGYSPAGALSVFEKFSQRSTMGDRRGSMIGEVLRLPRQSLEEYFRSHPPPQERRAKLEQVIASYGWPPDQDQRPIQSEETEADEAAVTEAP